MIRTLLDDSILMDIKIKVKRYDIFLKSYFGKPIAPMIGYTKKEYKNCLDNPTPHFFREMSNLYFFHQLDIVDELAKKFDKYALSKSNIYKK